MTEDEALEFQRDPLLVKKLAMRSYDERGKFPGVATPPLDHYMDVCWRHLCRQPARPTAAEDVSTSTDAPP